MRNLDVNLPYRNKKLLEIIDLKANGNVSEFAKIIGKSQQVINRLFKPDKRNGKYPNVTNEIESAVIEAFGLEENYFYLNIDNVDSKPKKLLIDPEKIAEKVALETTKPRLPVKVAAGQISEYYGGIYESQCERTPVINQFPSYDFTMIVQGNSMEPKFEGGDEIACKKVQKTIEWGKTYVVDTADGAFLKRLYDEGDSIRCVSYNKEYHDFLIDKNYIYGIYRVVGLMRFSI